MIRAIFIIHPKSPNCHFLLRHITPGSLSLPVVHPLPTEGLREEGAGGGLKKAKLRNKTAQSRVQSLLQSFQEGPIAAINVRDEILDAIRNTPVGDTDGWRKLIQGAPLAERKYLTQVYELLTDLAKEKRGLARDAFIYNSRTGGCVYYDLERA